MSGFYSDELFASTLVIFQYIIYIKDTKMMIRYNHLLPEVNAFFTLAITHITAYGE